MIRDETGDEVMSRFFRGKLKINTDYMIGEYGHGMGIGNKYDSYEIYKKKLSEKVNQENGKTYIGKDINMGPNSLSIVDPATEFAIGETPKVLIMFYNILYGISIRSLWKDDRENIVLGQLYDIPSPYSMQYSWWDIYGAYFIGPEDLEEGNYKVQLVSYENGIKNIRRIMSSNIEFSVLNTNH